MPVRYNGRLTGVKYVVSIAHGFFVARRNVVRTPVPDSPSRTRAWRSDSSMLRSVTSDDQCPAPNRAVSASAAAFCKPAIAATSSTAASRKLSRNGTLGDRIADHCHGHLTPEVDLPRDSVRWSAGGAASTTETRSPQPDADRHRYGDDQHLLAGKRKKTGPARVRALPYLYRDSDLLIVLRGRLRSRRLRLPGVEVVPVEDRVEAEEVRPLRLPPPERADPEHHDVTVAHLRVDDLRAVRERRPASERA